MPLVTSRQSLTAADPSLRISPPRIEPGAAAVTPLPNEIEAPEPGGVNWTTRKSFPITVSPSSRHLELHVDSRSTGVKLLLFNTDRRLTHVILLLPMIWNLALSPLAGC
jgi:hypothetical protein